MSLVQVLAGRFTATYNAKSLGQSADGIRISHQFFKRMVTGDAGGDTPQNGIYRGREQFLNFRLIEAAAAGVAEMIEPYHATTMNLGTIGQLDVGYGSVPGAAKQIILTAVSGTPSYIVGPTSMTMPLCALAENFPVDILLAPEVREVPVRLRVYPNSSGVFGTVA